MLIKTSNNHLHLIRILSIGIDCGLSFYKYQRLKNSRNIFCNTQVAEYYQTIEKLIVLLNHDPQK